MRNPGLRTGRDAQAYDAGPGTPHGVWPLEAANDLEPGVPQPDICKSLYLANAEISKTFTWRSIPHYFAVFIDLSGNSRYKSWLSMRLRPSAQSQRYAAIQAKNQERKSPLVSWAEGALQDLCAPWLIHIRDCRPLPGSWTRRGLPYPCSNCFLTRKVWVITV